MERETKNGYVKWSVLSILMVMLVAVLGVMWTEIKSIRNDSSENGRVIVQVRNDVKWIKDLIQGGELTFVKKK